MLEICSLSSSSSGNCTYVASENTKLLIDAGLSARRVVELLEGIGVFISEISAIVVSHEHTDHIKGIGPLSRKYKIPVFINEKAYIAGQKTIGELDDGLFVPIMPKEDFFIGDLSIEPIPVPHDAKEPLAFRVYSGGVSLSVATDIGFPEKYLLKRLEGSNFVLIESNHDEALLNHNPKYSFSLKKRILGKQGHLSNVACSQIIFNLIKSGTKHFMLGHLSPENNTLELAVSQIKTELYEKGLLIDRDYFLYPSFKDRQSKIFKVK